MTISRPRTVAAALVAVFIGQAAAPVFAHNERIHQQMTDYAYHLALAMAAVSAGDTTGNPLVAELAAMLNEDPDLPSFFDAAGLALPKLRALRSGLPDDPWPCVDPDVTALVDINADPQVATFGFPVGQVLSPGRTAAFDCVQDLSADEMARANGHWRAGNVAVERGDDTTTGTRRNSISAHDPSPAPRTGCGRFDPLHRLRGD